jgi:hypothetical protein
MSDFIKKIDNNKSMVEKQLAIDKDFSKIYVGRKSTTAMDRFV